MKPDATYARDALAWRDYQRFFRPDLRFDYDRPPVEERWRWSNYELHLDRARPAPPTEPRATVIVVHGAGGYGRMFAPAMRIAIRLKLEAIAIDLPGYGLSDTGAHAVAYEAWVNAVADLVSAERRRAPGRRVLLFGASMGGMVAYAVAASSHEVDGVAATCLLDPGDPEARACMVRHPAIARWGIPMLERASALDEVRVPVRWLANMASIANDPDLARVIARDRQGGGNTVSLKFLRTFLSSRLPEPPESFTRCPLLLAHPGDDRWTPLAVSLRFYDRLACPKELVVLENAGHFPVEEPGVTQLEEAFARFVERVLA